MGGGKSSSSAATAAAKRAVKDGNGAAISLTSDWVHAPP